MSVIPPPPPSSVQRPDNGCWKWGALGCGGLGCIFILAVAGLMWGIFKSPIGKQAFSSAFQSQAAMQQLKTVGHALDRYASDQKKYPRELKDLIPKYLPDERSLRISTAADSPRITYKQPAMNAPAETIVLQTDVTPPIPTPDAAPWTIKLRKDGRLEGTEYTYTDQYGKTRRIDFGAE